MRLVLVISVILASLFKPGIAKADIYRTQSEIYAVTGLLGSLTGTYRNLVPYQPPAFSQPSYQPYVAPSRYISMRGSDGLLYIIDTTTNQVVGVQR